MDRSQSAYVPVSHEWFRVSSLEHPSRPRGAPERGKEAGALLCRLELNYPHTAVWGIAEFSHSLGPWVGLASFSHSLGSSSKENQVPALIATEQFDVVEDAERMQNRQALSNTTTRY